MSQDNNRKTLREMSAPHRPAQQVDAKLFWWGSYSAKERRAWTQTDFFRQFLKVHRPEVVEKMDAFLKQAHTERPIGHRGTPRNLREELSRARVPLSAVLYCLEQTVWATSFPPAPSKKGWAALARAAQEAASMARKLQPMRLFFTDEDVARFEQIQQAASQNMHFESTGHDGKLISQQPAIVRISATAQVVSPTARAGWPTNDILNTARVQLDLVMKRYSGSGRPALIAWILGTAGVRETEDAVVRSLRRLRQKNQFLFEAAKLSLQGYDQLVAEMRCCGVLGPPQPFFLDPPQTTPPSADKLEKIVRRLDGVLRNGRGYVALCPKHRAADQKPNLSIVPGMDGRILLFCHAGCAPEAIATGLGLSMRDLQSVPQRMRRKKGTRQS